MKPWFSNLNLQKEAFGPDNVIPGGLCLGKWRAEKRQGPTPAQLRACGGALSPTLGHLFRVHEQGPMVPRGRTLSHRGHFQGKVCPLS